MTHEPNDVAHGSPNLATDSDNHDDDSGGGSAAAVTRESRRGRFRNHESGRGRGGGVIQELHAYVWRWSPYARPYCNGDPRSCQPMIARRLRQRPERPPFTTSDPSADPFRAGRAILRVARRAIGSDCLEWQAERFVLEQILLA